MIDQLRQRLQALQKAPGIEGRPNALPFGIPAIDTMLGGGLARGALHEIAATGEAHLPVAAGFALAVARRAAPSPRLFWVSEDMAFAESGMADTSHQGFLTQASFDAYHLLNKSDGGKKGKEGSCSADKKGKEGSCSGH